MIWQVMAAQGRTALEEVLKELGILSIGATLQTYHFLCVGPHPPLGRLSARAVALCSWLLLLPGHRMRVANAVAQ